MMKRIEYSVAFIALTAALTSADSLPGGREAAVVTFVVTASGVTLAGVGAAFWGLLAGGALLLLFRRRSERPLDVEVAGADEAADRAQ